MDVEYAKTLLRGCVRAELRDHAFGDAEVFWIDEHKREVATGYFGGDDSSVTVNDLEDETGQTFYFFKGEDARALRECGTEGPISRNDETGPDEFIEGAVMPGLTKEAVFRELTGE